MSEYPTFPNAPIVEAILDIQVDHSKEITLAHVDSIYQSVKDRFPEKQQRKRGTVNIVLSQAGPATETAADITGYRYRSKSEMKVIQSRLDGYSFNKLKPYENWETLRSEAKEFWDIYKNSTKPLKIKRISLRYINRIELPLPFEDFKEYILTIPELAPGINHGVANFLMRLLIPNTDINATAIINEVLEKPLDDPPRLPIIFDVDVIKTTAYDSDSDAIWDDLELLRAFKNDIFFNSMTDKAKDLFK